MAALFEDLIVILRGCFHSWHRLQLYARTFDTADGNENLRLLPNVILLLFVLSPFQHLLPTQRDAKPLY